MWLCHSSGSGGSSTSQLPNAAAQQPTTVSQFTMPETDRTTRKLKGKTFALEAIGAALAGGRAEHEDIGTLRRRRMGQLLRRPAQPRPGNCKDGHRLDRQEGNNVCRNREEEGAAGPHRSR
jgi:hypothetical protein